MRQGRENPCPVTRIDLAAASAAVVHPPQHVERIHDQLMAALPLDMGDKSDPAAVMLQAGIVQAVFRR